MGYTTEFAGGISIVPPLNPTEISYLRRFSQRRRTQRHAGPYFVDGAENQERGGDEDVIDYNCPIDGQPPDWSQWVPTSDGTALVCEQGEDFHCGPEWMEYLIDHFLKPGGAARGVAGFEDFTFDHMLNGLIHAQGEDPEDEWQMVVLHNEVCVATAEEEIPDQCGDVLARIDEVLRDTSVSDDAMRSRPVG